MVWFYSALDTCSFTTAQYDQALEDVARQNRYAFYSLWSQTYPESKLQAIGLINSGDQTHFTTDGAQMAADKVLAFLTLGSRPLSINGSSLALNIRKITSSATSIATDYTVRVDASGGAVTYTLSSTPTNGQVINVKKIDSSSNAVTISGNGHSIDGNSSVSITMQ